jgi:hypothetical protein
VLLCCVYGCVCLQALRFAKAMKAPLIFCSSSHSINIKTIFKIVVSKVFDLKCDVKKIDTVGDPIVGTDCHCPGPVLCTLHTSPTLPTLLLPPSATPPDDI